MKYLIYLCLLTAPHTQTEPKHGIVFEQQMQWKHILEKARKEYKYIFIECSSEKDKPKINEGNQLTETGIFYNSRFISIQLTTENDPSLTRQLIETGVHIATIATKGSSPLYLYFNPEGKLVHQGLGIKKGDELIALGRQAINPASQYYNLLERYLSGVKEYSLMPTLALTAKSLGNTALADSIALDYKNNYLEKLSPEDMARKENLEFISKFPYLIYSHDRLFELFFQQPKLVDKEMYVGYSQKVTGWIIQLEEIVPFTSVTPSDSSYIPDWSKIKSVITQKYGSRTADKLVNDAMIDYLFKTERWEEYVNVSNKAFKQNPPKAGQGISSDPWLLNSKAWDLFVESSNYYALQNALNWSILSLELDPVNVQYMDTKANLLYKLGRVQEAIAVEKKAIETDNYQAEKTGAAQGYFVKEYTETIKKMETGIPTWKNK